MKQLNKTDRFIITSNKMPFQNDVFVVTSKYKYISEGDEWYEYEFLHGDKKLFLEIEEDDAFVTFAQLKTKQLNIDKGEFRLQQPAAHVLYNDKVYHLVERGVANYYEDDTEEAERFCFYDFVNGFEVITVEVWEDSSIEIHASIKISNKDVRLLAE